MFCLLMGACIEISVPAPVFQWLVCFDVDQHATKAKEGPTLKSLQRLIADAKNHEKHNSKDLQAVAYDKAVKAALQYLKVHPEQRHKLKPILTEIVQRAKRLKTEAATQVEASAAEQ